MSNLMTPNKYRRRIDKLWDPFVRDEELKFGGRTGAQFRARVREVFTSAPDVDPYELLDELADQVFYKKHDVVNEHQLTLPGFPVPGELRFVDNEGVQRVIATEYATVDHVIWDNDLTQARFEVERIHAETSQARCDAIVRRCGSNTQRLVIEVLSASPSVE